MLYGEGQNAFIRLQLQILSKSDDESIFAWENYLVKEGEVGGLLAGSPEAFRGASTIRQEILDSHRPPYAMTNKGLRLELSLMPNPHDPAISYDRWLGSPLAPLNCVGIWGERHQVIALQFHMEDGKYKRLVSLSRLEPAVSRIVMERAERTVVYID